MDGDEPAEAARNWWSRPDVPDVVLLSGPAQAYRDAVHDDLKLVRYDGGGAAVRHRDRTFRARAGDLVAHHPGQAHAGTPDPGPTCWQVICVAPGTVAELVDPAEVRFDPPVLPDLELGRSFGELFGLFQQQSDALLLESELLDFLLSLVKRAGSTPAGAIGADTARIAGITRDHLAAHLDRNLTLTALAAEAGASRFAVSRACVAQFGVPPHALHLRLRLDHGCELIRNGVPLAQVSLATGFHDQAHFTRTFSRTYGMTPIQFRGSWDGTSDSHRKLERRLDR